MMVTKESLREKYAVMDTTFLLEIANDKTGYSELANLVALEELKRRGVPNQDIEQHRPMLRKITQKMRDNCLVDLNLWQKSLYFIILWFPRVRRFYQPEFKRNGFILKDNQSNYYSVLGFLSAIGSLITATQSALQINFFIAWGTCFIAAYLFDITFNRERQKKNIERAMASEELPWGF